MPTSGTPRARACSRTVRAYGVVPVWLSRITASSAVGAGDHLAKSAKDSTATAGTPPRCSSCAPSSAAWKLVPVPTTWIRRAPRSESANGPTSSSATARRAAGCASIIRCSWVGIG